MTRHELMRRLSKDPTVYVLQTLLDEMFYAASLQGETRLLNKIFSH